MSADKPAESAPRKGSLWRTVKAVAWSFMGIRKHGEVPEDAARITPFHVIGVGLAGILFFVLSLMALVNWVVAK